MILKAKKAINKAIKAAAVRLVSLDKAAQVAALGAIVAPVVGKPEGREFVAAREYAAARLLYWACGVKGQPAPQLADFAAYDDFHAASRYWLTLNPGALGRDDLEGKLGAYLGPEPNGASHSREPGPRNVVFFPAALAFTQAIKEGRLSDKPGASNYAGDYMYMGTWAGVDRFKHASTRVYLPVPEPVAAPATPRRRLDRFNASQQPGAEDYENTGGL